MPTIEIKGTDELTDGLGKLPEKFMAAVVRGLNKGSRIVYHAAVDNAPKSPTQAQLDATRKHDKKWLAANRKRVRARLAKKAAREGRVTGHHRPSPGGLEESVEFEVNAQKLELSVFVADNSKARKYAKRIHDEKGVSWKKRGPGTVAKGARADDKFIERALKENETHIGAIIEDEMRKVKL